MLEWTASVMIAIEPVIAPATTFSAIRIVFGDDRQPCRAELRRPLDGRRGDQRRDAVTRCLPRRGAVAHGASSRAALSARAARPRWLIASFSAGASSAIVRSGPLRSSGTKAGS